MSRRLEFTSDPRRLAAQLRADLLEIAESAAQIGKRGDERLRIELDRLYHMLMTESGHVASARAALDDAAKWNEPVEYEVTDTIEALPNMDEASHQVDSD